MKFIHKWISQDMSVAFRSAPGSLVDFEANSAALLRAGGVEDPRVVILRSGLRSEDWDPAHFRERWQEYVRGGRTWWDEADDVVRRRLESSNEGLSGHAAGNGYLASPSRPN